MRLLFATHAGRHSRRPVHGSHAPFPDVLEPCSFLRNLCPSSAGQMPRTAADSTDEWTTGGDTSPTVAVCPPRCTAAVTSLPLTEVLAAGTFADIWYLDTWSSYHRIDVFRLHRVAAHSAAVIHAAHAFATVRAYSSPRPGPPNLSRQQSPANVIGVPKKSMARQNPISKQSRRRCDYPKRRRTRPARRIAP